MPASIMPWACSCTAQRYVCACIQARGMGAAAAEAPQCITNASAARTASAAGRESAGNRVAAAGGEAGGGAAAGKRAAAAAAAAARKQEHVAG